MQNGENPQSTQGNGLLIGVLAGAAIGVGLGLLFAPRAGSGLRRQMGSLSTSLRDGASRRYRQARDRVDEVVAGLTEDNQEVRGTVGNAASRGARHVDGSSTEGTTEHDREGEGTSGGRSSTASRGSEEPAF